MDEHDADVAARHGRSAVGAPAPHGRRVRRRGVVRATGSTPRATCGRAITPGSTPRDSSGSRGGPRTSSTAVGTRSSPSRSRRFSASCPACEDAAVIGWPDDRLGEVPVAVIVGDASDEELLAMCRNELAPYKIPVAFHRAESLARHRGGQAAASPAARRPAGRQAPTPPRPERRRSRRLLAPAVVAVAAGRLATDPQRAERRVDEEDAAEVLHRVALACLPGMACPQGRLGRAPLLPASGWTTAGRPRCRCSSAVCQAPTSRQPCVS